MTRDRVATFFNSSISDDKAEALYEVTPTLEEWKAMQEGREVEAPMVVES